jgi:spermidine synthase
MSVFEGIKIPTVIYRTQSEHNGTIEVTQDGNTRRLIAENVTQSMNFDSPAAERMFWGRLTELLMVEQPDLKSILILGLGGGTVQHMISRAFSGVYIVSVELDPEMVDVAKQFFNIGHIANHKIIVEDACRVVVSPEEVGLTHQAFNAVVVDIYCGSKYPDLGKAGNFIAHVCKMTVPGGLVVFNRIYLDDHQEDVDMFIETVENFLHDVKTIVIPGKTNSDNVLIYGRV